MTIYQTVAEHTSNFAGGLRVEDAVTMAYIAGVMLEEFQPAAAARIRAILHREHDAECGQPGCMQAISEYFLMVLRQHGEL